MQTFPLVSALLAVVVAAVIVLWKAGASDARERPSTADDPGLNQSAPIRDKQL
jgi:hypothetical protein